MPTKDERFQGPVILDFFQMLSADFCESSCMLLYTISTLTIVTTTVHYPPELTHLGTRVSLGIVLGQLLLVGTWAVF